LQIFARIVFANIMTRKEVNFGQEKKLTSA